MDRRRQGRRKTGRFDQPDGAIDADVEALADMNGVWIDKVDDRHPPKMIVPDMDSSVSPTHGEQEGTKRPFAKGRGRSQGKGRAYDEGNHLTCRLLA